MMDIVCSNRPIPCESVTHLTPGDVYAILDRHRGEWHSSCSDGVAFFWTSDGLHVWYPLARCRDGFEEHHKNKRLYQTARLALAKYIIGRVPPAGLAPATHRV